MNEHLNAAIEKIGGARETAAYLKLSHQAVYAWVKRGFAPTKRAAQIERKTGIPRKKLINPKLVKLLNI
jgi:hypothetical protein